MDYFIKRAIFAFGLFWLGLHVIGLSIVQNNGDVPSNPTWHIFYTLFMIELWILKAVLLFALCSFLIMIVGAIREIQQEKASAVDIKSVEEKHFPTIEKPPEKEKIDTNILTQKHKPEITLPTTPLEKTPEELKLEAIKQITRGW